MAAPFYLPVDGKHPDRRPDQGNTGLWFTRFYDRFSGADWQVGDEGKRGWIESVTGPRGNRQALEDAARRMAALGAALQAQVADFKTEASFATGLGLSHPVENGMTWHPTLGVPYLPGSSVKGLLRGWCDAWMEHESDSARDALVARWFGSPDAVGTLSFFDALPTGQLTLVADVMTPHLGKWYEQGDDIRSARDYADKAPADWHSPVPVPFLVVGRGASFRFMIAPRLSGNTAADAQARQDSQAAMQALAQALEWAGAGAKTATGYGRMQREGAQREADLAAAGIETGSAQWLGAKVTRNKSTGELTVTSASGERAAPVTSPLAQQVFDSLDEAARKKLKDGKKPLLMDATVETTGNLTRILSLQVSPPA